MSGSPERVIKYAALATVLDQLTGAAATATTQATAAATSNTNSSHWAEGSDAQVIALGGEKSSKGWAAESEAQADRSESASNSAADLVNYVSFASVEQVASLQQAKYSLVTSLAPYFDPTLVAEVTATWDEATTSPSIIIS
jgi:hypothetical protein